MLSEQARRLNASVAVFAALLIVITGAMLIGGADAEGGVSTYADGNDSVNVGTLENPLASLNTTLTQFDFISILGVYPQVWFVEVGGTVNISKVSNFMGIDNVEAVFTYVTEGFGLTITDGSVSGTITKSGTIQFRIAAHNTETGEYGENEPESRNSTIYAVDKGGDVGTSYAITYHDTQSGGETKTVNVLVGRDLVFPTGVFEHEGMVLTGWALGGPGGPVSHPGDTMRPTGNMDFYTVYQKIDSANHESSLDRIVELGSNGINEVIFDGDCSGVWDALDPSGIAFHYNVDVDKNADWLTVDVHRDGDAMASRPVDRITISGQPTEVGNFYVHFHIVKERDITGTDHKTSDFYFLITVPSDSDVQYSVQFDANGGLGQNTLPSQKEYSWGDTITLPDGQGLTKNGMTLVGWRATGTGVVDALYPLGGRYVVERNVMFEAEWDDDPYVLVFNPLDAPGVEAVVVHEGELVPLPGTDVEQEGMTFAGWENRDARGQIYAIGFIYSVPQGGPQLVGYWIPDGAKTVTITFNANGGNESLSQVVEPGKRIVLPQNNFTRPGYTFAGWSTEIGGTIIQDDTYLVETNEATLTLYANWTQNEEPDPDPDDPEPEIKYYTVIFNPGPESERYYDAATVRSGNTVSEPVPDPYRIDGYAFQYWVYGGEQYDFTKPVTSNLILNAFWIQVATVTYTEGELSATIVPADTSLVFTIDWGDGQRSRCDGEPVTHNYGRTFHGQIMLSLNGGMYTYLDVHVVDIEDSGQEPVAPTLKAVVTDKGNYWELSADGSTNVDQYEWYMDGTKISTARVYNLYKTDVPVGEHSITLIGKGSGGQVVQLDEPIIIEVEPDEPSTEDPGTGDDGPDAALVPSITITKTEDGWVFDGSDSTGPIAHYVWTLDDTEIGEDADKVTVETIGDGKHEIVLIVTDESGDVKKSASREFEVEDNAPVAPSPDNPNVPGIASVKAEVEIREIEGGWELDGSNSYGKIKGYNWTVDGKFVGNTEKVTLTGELSPGTHKVVLVVTGEDGTTSTDDTQSIVVEGGGDDDRTWLYAMVVIVVILVILAIVVKVGGV